MKMMKDINFPVSTKCVHYLNISAPVDNKRTIYGTKLSRLTSSATLFLHKLFIISTGTITLKIMFSHSTKSSIPHWWINELDLKIVYVEFKLNVFVGS